MVTDARTTARNYPKPHVANTRGEEFARLITAMEMVDADMAAAYIAIGLRALADHGHAIADITGLQSALNNKAALSHSHALASLSDTSGLASPTSGQVPVFLAGAWSLLSILVSPEFSGTPRAPTASVGTNTTQIATTAFVKAAIDALVNASPGQLDTLVELAAALGNDANFAATMTAALAGKQPYSAALAAITALAVAADVRTGTSTSTVLTPGAVADAMAWNALTDAASIAIDHAAGVNRYLTLGGNRAVAAPTNAKRGWPLNLLIRQDGTGSRVITGWDATFDFGEGTAPTLSTAANAEDLVTFICLAGGKFAYLGIKRRVD